MAKNDRNASGLDTDYSIWSLEYCHADMPHDFFGGAGVFSNKGIIRIPMPYTLIVGGEVGGPQRVALVDCGFRNDYWLERYAFSNWESPQEVLGRLGFTPEDVDTILVTHMHFDHMGNFEAFPNAQLVVQFDEYAGWSNAVNTANLMSKPEEQAWIYSSFDPQDLARAAQGLADGKIRFIHGDEEVLPGVTARLARDSHTFGSQLFRIETRNGPFITSGDTVYWYSNIEQMWVPGYHQGNAFNLIELYRSLQTELKGEINRIIPGHDPEIAKRHPSWLSDSGNSITEVNLRESDASRVPDGGRRLLV